eukprot:TRINITY_DN1150_c0_g1_i1.p1 TRINITY_DN1150_c0_g1~~TRINITY_DN1150_c0_g1_i1.p1  ORF type:complete len:128 (-),score=33.39 TRINITY_DN1150_c0_g1_i1:18-401(-)
MSETKNTRNVSRRTVLKGTAATTGAALIGASFPMHFIKNAHAQTFRGDPGSSGSVKFGFNVPQSGPYADEGADELRAYQLAVKHLNGEGDGGMLNTIKPLEPVSYTHLRAHETVLDLVCRLLLEKKK